MEKNYQLAGPLDSEKDVGKNIAVTFDRGTIKSEKYGAANVVGHLLCILPYGKFPKLDMEHIEQEEKALVDLVTELIIELGLSEKIGDKFYEWLNTPLVARISTFLVPDVNLQNSKLMHYLQLSFFLLDDMIANILCFKLDVEPSYPKVKEITKVFVQIIRGHYASLEEIPELDLPLFKLVYKLLSLMHQTTISSKLDTSHFTEAIVNWVETNTWEREDKEGGGKDNYMFLRPMSIGVSPMIEATLLIKGICISKGCREHFLFKKYLNLLCVHFAFVNDIASLKKEINNDEVHNLILIEHKKYSLQKSIDKIVKKANKLLTEIKETGLTLQSYFIDEPNIASFIESTECFVDGSIYWHQESPRYGETKCGFVTVEYMTDLKESFSANSSSFFNASNTSIHKPNNDIKHLAIIADGNRRYARKHEIPITDVHQSIAHNTPDLAKNAWESGISTVSFWLLSPDNLHREPDELRGLFRNLENCVTNSLDLCRKMDGKFKHLGSKEQLPPSLVKKLISAENKTKDNSSYTLNLAINYNGRQEIIHAINEIYKSNPLADEVTESELAKFLYTGNQKNPEPDLIIRTGCDNDNFYRLSGFMSWQNAYSELKFLHKCFPEFTVDDLQETINNFTSVQRRFGK